MITKGCTVIITKGCRPRNIDKNVLAEVVAVVELGADYGHSIKLYLRLLNGFNAREMRVLYARHRNRLADPIVNLNDGNPLHTVKIRLVHSPEPAGTRSQE